MTKTIKIVMVGLSLLAVFGVSRLGHTVNAKASATEPVVTVKTLPTVGADLNNVINNDGGTEVGVSLVDLDGGREYDAGESNVLFHGASTAKLVAVVDYMRQVELGKATMNQQIDGVEARTLLQRMIENSDNDAWSEINVFLGDQQQQTYADSIGMKHFTNTAYNTVTTTDEAKLLTELYQGKLLTSAHRQLLYHFMTNTTSTDLIQAALPAEATVYHKYGELWGNLHDTAIISYRGRNFALVIFTKNGDTLDDYATRVDLIHQLTQTAFKDVMAAS